MLVYAGASVNAATDHMNLTALMIAAFEDDTKIPKILIEAGAKVNATTDTGKTALMLAQQKDDENVVKLLREAGLSPQ